MSATAYSSPFEDPFSDGEMSPSIASDHSFSSPPPSDSNLDDLFNGVDDYLSSSGTNPGGLKMCESDDDVPKTPEPFMSSNPNPNRVNPKTTEQRENADNILLFEKLGYLGITLVLLATETILVLMFAGTSWLPMVDPFFALYMFLFFSIFFLVAVIGGYGVSRGWVSVVCTRKVIHFFSFTLPFVLPDFIPFDKTITTYMLTGCAVFIAYIPLIESIRKESTILKLAFLSFDRKEDPFTLFWAVSQSATAFVVILPMNLYTTKVLGYPSFNIIAIMTVALGDGLAEPIGVNFGYHKYKTRAIFTDQIYTRSIEGSLCVFFACLLSILAVTLIPPGHNPWSPLQMCFAILLIPIISTITEAIAPHSWDNALILLVSGLGVIITFHISDLVSLVMD